MGGSPCPAPKLGGLPRRAGELVERQQIKEQSVTEHTPGAIAVAFTEAWSGHDLTTAVVSPGRSAPSTATAWTTWRHSSLGRDSRG
jgi:hypothetical protein